MGFLYAGDVPHIHHKKSLQLKIATDKLLQTKQEGITYNVPPCGRLLQVAFIMNHVMTGKVLCSSWVML